MRFSQSEAAALLYTRMRCAERPCTLLYEVWHLVQSGSLADARRHLVGRQGELEEHEQFVVRVLKNAEAASAAPDPAQAVPPHLEEARRERYTLLLGALMEFDQLVAESEGVAGLNLNGEVMTWEEARDLGWTSKLTEAVQEFIRAKEQSNER